MSRRDGIEQIKWSFKPEGSHREWLWYTKIQPIIYRVCAVLSGCLSILSYLGVISGMQGVSNSASPYSIAVHDDKATGTGITVFVLLTLGYTCYVVMWALFEMKISSIMELVTNQGTWPLSMSFNARMVARLAAPLAFFYLGWVHENQTKGNDGQGTADQNGSQKELFTAFSRFYQIQVIPVMGERYAAY